MKLQVQSWKKLLVFDSKTNKYRYEKSGGGTYWDSSVTLDDFCYVIMHLLFLGITKALVQEDMSRVALCSWNFR